MTEISLRQYHLELDALLDNEALEEVIGHCRHILKFFPKNLKTYQCLGNALLGKARYDQAGSVLRRVLSVEPGDKLAHAGMSQIYRERQNWEHAIWHMERAFEQDPNNVTIQKTLRELYSNYQAGDYGKLQLTRGALARMYVHSGLHEKAIAELQNALRDNPDRIDLRLLLAEALWDSGYTVEASETATDVLRVLPYCLSANRILSDFWLQNNRPTDAQPFLARVEALNPYIALELVGEASQLEQDPFLLPRLDWNVAEASMLAASTPDWMSEIGGVLNKPEDVQLAGDDSLPDWMNELTQSAPPPPEQQKRVTDALNIDLAATEADMPDWMADLERAAQAQPDEPASADWMSDLAASDTDAAAQPVAANYLPEDEPAADSIDAWPDMGDILGIGDTPPQADDDLNFLDDVAAAPGQPDWMADLAASGPDDSATNWLENLPAEDTAAEETPDWFADMQAAARVDAPADSSELFDAASSDAPSLDDLDWLDTDDDPLAERLGEVAQDEDEFVPAEPGERVRTGFTGLLSALDDDNDEEEDDDPLAWLNAPDTDEAGGVLADMAPPAPSAPTDDDDDWLGAFNAHTNVPDAAANVEDTEDAAEEDDSELMALLRGDVQDDDLDDLDDLDNFDPTDPSTNVLSQSDQRHTIPLSGALADSTSPAPVDNTDDDDPLSWLFAEDDALAEAELEEALQTPAAAQPGTDPLAWLQQEDTPSNAEEESAMFDDSDRTPEDQPQFDEEDWLAGFGDDSDETDDATGDALPDWLGSGPAEAAPEPTGAGSDWLSAMNLADEDGDDAAESPAAGSTDWLAEMLGGTPEDEAEPSSIASWLEDSPGPDAEPDMPEWMGVPADEPTLPEPDEADDDADDAVEPLATPDWLRAMSIDEGDDDDLPPQDEPLVGPVPDLPITAPTGDAPDASGEPIDLDLPGTPDWLNALDEPEDAAETPDWLSEDAADDEPAVEPAEEEADWLGELAVEEPPAGQPLIESAEADAAPGWLGELAMLGDDDEDEAAPALPPDVEPGEAPDWLSAMAPVDDEQPEETAEPAAEPAAEETPDWLSAMAPLDDGEEELEEAPGLEFTPAESEAEPAAEETPDWLSAMAPLGDDEELEEAPGLEFEPTESEAEPAAEETPDWLSAMAPLDDEEEPEETPGYEIEPTESEAEPAAEETPDWLSAMAPLGDDGDEELEEAPGFEFAAAESDAESAAEETPDWLSAMAPLDDEELEEAPGLEFEPSESEAEPAAEETPDWLSAMAPLGDEELEEAPGLEFTPDESEAQPAAEETPDWLSAMAPLDDEELEEAPGLEFTPDESEAEPAAEETPDWLSAMAPLGDEEEPEETPGYEIVPAESEAEPAAEETPDWLSAMAPAQLGDDGDEELEEAPGLEFIPDESEAEPAAEEQPDWLSAMAPLDDEEEPEETTGLEFTPDESEAEPAAEETPDWLSAMGPAQLGDDGDEELEEAPGYEIEPTESEAEPAAEETPDWLSAMAPAQLGDDDAEELEEAPGLEFIPDESEAEPAAEEQPDWLSAMVPEQEEFEEYELEADDTDETESEAAEPAAESDQPDWLSAVAPLAAAEPEQADADEVAPADAEAEPVADDWVKSMIPEQEDFDEYESEPDNVAPAAAEPAAEQADWLMEPLDDELEQTDAYAADTPADAASENLTIEPAELTADWISGMAPLDDESVEDFIEDEASAIEAEPEETTPDWMDAIAALDDTPADEDDTADEIEVEPAAAPQAEQTEEAVMPDADEALPLAESGADEQPSTDEDAVEDEPLWTLEAGPLGADFYEEAPGEAAEEETQAEPTSLSSLLDDEMPLGADAELDEMANEITDPGGVYYAAEQQVEVFDGEHSYYEDGIPDDSGQLADELADEEAVPTWLDEMPDLEDGAEIEEPAVEAAPEAEDAAYDTLEWLNEMGTLEAEPEEGLEGEALRATSELEIGPDWLREVGMLEAEAVEEDETDDEPTPAPREEIAAQAAVRFNFSGGWRPRWLRAEDTAEVQAVVEDETDDTPDWLDEDPDGPPWLRRVMEEDEDDSDEA